MHDLVISLHQQMKCCSGCSLASFLWHILYIVVYFSYKNLKDLNPSFILLHRCCQIINKITRNLNIQWESLIMPCRCKVSVNVLYNLHSLLANWVFSAHCTDGRPARHCWGVSIFSSMNISVWPQSFISGFHVLVTLHKTEPDLSR